MKGTTDNRFRSAIAVVGAGPVGLMLALFLDQFGVPCVLFNTGTSTRWHPKGATENCRTMEHLRRLGIAEPIRKLGLPPDHPTDVAYFTRFNSYELARLSMPSTQEALERVAAAPATDQVPEPIHRANQRDVERYLFEHALRRPNIVMRFGWEVDRFQEDSSGVDVSATAQNTGAREHWRAQYLVGCDGGRSFVRHAIGIRFQGEPGIEQNYFGGRMFSTHLRAPNLYRDLLRQRRSWQYWAVNPDIRLTLISVNGDDEFLCRLKARVPHEPPSDDAVAEAMRRCIGAETKLEIIAHEPWTAGMALVAEHFGSGRVLLAGDAVHLFTPTGGFGMNTGIDDASNLAWKLAAAVQGWGGPRLLESYDIERRPIAVRNTNAGRQFTVNIGETNIDAAIEDDSPAGEAARREASSMLARFGEQFASIGVQLGARYDGSPLVCADGASPPPDSFLSYTPTSVPGGRAPHLWLDGHHAQGNSLYDRLGTGFTVLRLGSQAVDVSAIMAAAARRQVPLKLLDIPDPVARELYGCDVTLVRPDQYIAWRGNRVPEDCTRIVARVTGFDA